MKRILLILTFLFWFFLSNGQTYTLSYLQSIENNVIVAEDNINEDFLVINENSGKIILKTIHPGSQNQIFKIIKKRFGDSYSKEKHAIIEDENMLVYECEFKNENGISTVWIEIDTFYQFIEIWAEYDIKNLTGNYLKYSYSNVEK